MNIIDRAFAEIAPGIALKRIRARAAIRALDTVFSGASRTKHSLRGWGVRFGATPDDELLPELDVLRERSRDLYKNNPIATGGIDTNRTNVIGTGLKLQVRIDREALGLEDADADAWESLVERKWRAWANYPDADAGRRMDFNEIQDLAYLSFLQSGEVFALLPLIRREATVSDLRVQLLEADRVSTPTDKTDDGKLMSGIEVDKYGAPTGYWVETTPPGLLQARTWQRVAAFGQTSGRTNVIHLYKAARPGQRRGYPYLTPVIERLKQLGRYEEAELMAAVVSGMFTAFITSDAGDSDILQDALPAGQQGDTAQGASPDQSAAEEPPAYEMGNGSIVGLAPGEKVETANPGRPNPAFDGFMTATLRQVGMGLGIPYELLVKHFQASYSAARAALMEAWKDFRTRRTWFASRFCQPIYEEWLMDMVLRGEIVAPGFLDDITVRRAYCGAEWVGPTPGQLDPVKETDAALMRVEGGLSTLAEETAQLSGGDWERKIRQRAKEEKLKKELGLDAPPPATAPPTTEPKQASARARARARTKEPDLFEEGTT